METGQAETLARMEAHFRPALMSFFLRRIGNYAEAQDLTQQVFVRLAAVDGLGRVEHTTGYVFTIAANLLKDRRRKMRTSPPAVCLPDHALIDELIDGAVEDRSPERVILARETLSDVLRTLDALGEKTRDIFILFRLENMKQREIAELYGIAQSTVEKHIMKATLRLAQKYGSDRPW